MLGGFGLGAQHHSHFNDHSSWLPAQLTDEGTVFRVYMICHWCSRDTNRVSWTSASWLNDILKSQATVPEAGLEILAGEEGEGQYTLSHLLVYPQGQHLLREWLSQPQANCTKAESKEPVGKLT